LAASSKSKRRPPPRVAAADWGLERRGKIGRKQAAAKRMASKCETGGKSPNERRRRDEPRRAGDDARIGGRMSGCCRPSPAGTHVRWQRQIQTGGFGGDSDRR
jgi:hypothetical protein